MGHPLAPALLRIGLVCLPIYRFAPQMVYQYILINDKLGKPVDCTQAPSYSDLLQAGPYKGLPPSDLYPAKSSPGPPGADSKTCEVKGFPKQHTSYPGNPAKMAKYQVTYWGLN